MSTRAVRLRICVLLVIGLIAGFMAYWGRTGIDRAVPDERRAATAAVSHDDHAQTKQRSAVKGQAGEEEHLTPETHTESSSRDEYQNEKESGQENRAPVARAGGDRSVSKGEEVVLDGTGSYDPDGDVLTYVWRQVRGPKVSLRDTETAKPRFGAPEVTRDRPAEFALVVSDGLVESQEDTVSILIKGSQPKQFTRTYSIAMPVITPSQRFLAGLTSEETYSVEVPELPRYSDQPGVPILPVQPVRLLLPPDGEIPQVAVVPGQRKEIAGTYMIEAGQKPYPLSYEGPIEETPPDADVYSSDEFYPGELYSNISIQRKMGYRILTMSLHPVQYLPAEGKVCYYESLDVVVGALADGMPRAESGALEDVPASASCRYRGLREDGEAILKVIDNPEDLETYRSSSGSDTGVSGILSSQPEPGLQDVIARGMSEMIVSAEYLYGDPGDPGDSGDPDGGGGTSLLPEPGPYEYVIITSDALANVQGQYTFQDLIGHKAARGTRATIVTTEYIYSNYDGTRPDGGVDNPTRIRNFIIDAYNNWATRYVLLGGDGDGADVGGESGDGIVPGRALYTPIDSSLMSDFYYSCLDGTFDYDGDGQYGERNDGISGGLVDVFAEVYVGRACVDNEDEVSNFVAKTITHAESAPVMRALMVGENLGWIPWGKDYKEEIRLGSSAWGCTTAGFSDEWTVDTLYDKDGTWHKSVLIDLINSDQYTVLNHLGHANVTYVMKMFNSDVDNLTNTVPFFGYSQGCYDGSYDNRSTSKSGYYQSDSISEHFTTSSHGAYAFIGNTRYGWGSYSTTAGPSQYYDREFFDAVFGEDIVEAGQANADSKEDLLWYFSASHTYGRFCAYEATLFGDPQALVSGAEEQASEQGAVGFEEQSYEPGDVGLWLRDIGLNLDSDALDTALVTVSSSGGDSETVVVQEIWNAAGIFSGAIPMVCGRANPGNGMLEARLGDTLTVVYHDADDGTGNPATVTGTAMVDGGLMFETGGGIVSSPVFGDIDGDLEVVVGSDDGNVYAWHSDGTMAAGWPQTTGGAVRSSPALGDIDGDGDLEIVVGSNDGDVYVWHEDGSAVAGWPQATGGEVNSSPALGDLDGDGDLEIVVGSDDGSVYAWHGDGTAVSGWPQATGGEVNSSPALGDLDGDGDLEIVIGSDDGSVYAWHGDGTAVSGWPQATGGAVRSSPALGDLDGDSVLEIVVGSDDGNVYVWHPDGTTVAGWPQTTGGAISSSPALGDLDGDGRLEVVVGSEDHAVYVWYYNGISMGGGNWPEVLGSRILASPVLGDIDGDQYIDVIVGLEDGRLYALTRNSFLIAGWPRQAGSQIRSSPALADFDHDGDIEVAVGSTDGYCYIWDIKAPYHPAYLEWPMFRYFRRRTGCYEPGGAAWMPDLEVTAVSRITAGSCVGDTIVLRAELQNRGNEFSGPFHVRWRIDGDVVETVSHGDCAPGETGYIEYTWCDAERGIHTVEFTADCDSEVLESNEANNTFVTDILISPLMLKTNSVVWSSPVSGDLDGDGDLEIIVGSYDCKVYAWHGDGTLVSGWPQTTGSRVSSSPALGDLDGDGDLEVIISSWDRKVYAWHGDGTLVSGWPQQTGAAVNSSPALGDLDGDGTMEVVAGSCDRKVYAWHGDGTLVSGWPQTTGSAVYSSPALGDLDGDGMPEVIVGSYDRKVYAWHGDGSAVSGWPQMTGSLVYSSPALGDLDGDGDFEVVIGSWDRKVYAWHGDGTLVSGWPQMTGSKVNASPALGDLDGDGDLEVVVGSRDRKVYAWHGDGSAVSGWPQMTGSVVDASPVLGDIDGDGDIEILVGSYDRKVYSWHGDGTAVSGWPKLTGGRVSSSTTLGDIDRDGDIEIFVGSWDTYVYLWDLDSAYNSRYITWGMFRHDRQHTGQYGVPYDDMSDLTVTGITYTPPWPRPGEQVEFQATLTNVGSKDGSAFVVSWLLDGQEVASEDHTGLAAGASVALSCTLIAAAGDHTIEIMADAASMVDELDEDNNRSSLSFTVLTEQGIDIVAHRVVFVPEEPMPGDTVLVRIELENQGDGPSGPFHIAWRINGIEVARQAHTGLARGEIAYPEYAWNTVSGIYTVTVVADSDGEVAEYNEGNNSVTQGIDVTAVDLAAGSIAWSPAHPNRGDTIVFSVPLENRGDKISGPFSVRWRINGEEVAQASYNTYAPGEVNSLQYVLSDVAHGAHTVEFTADYTGAIEESDEGNNTASASILVSPVKFKTGSVVRSSPVAGDLDGDGDLEIIVGSYDCKVYAWHGDGTFVSGWPQTTGSRVSSSPALGDLDGDGDLEVIIGSWDRKVYAWHGDGTVVAGWPQSTGSIVRASPSLGDLDGDGDLEVVVGSYDRKIYAWHGDGTAVSGSPQAAGSIVESSPALGDLDGDGDLEVIVGCWDRKVYAWHGDGTAVSGWPQATGSKLSSSPALGDLDADGDLEVVIGSWDRKVYAWHGNGTAVSGWPRMTGNVIIASPALGDLDDDGTLEIVIGSYDRRVYAWHHDGSTVSGWPKMTGSAVESSPALGDIDGDGDIEVLVGSWDRKVYVWHGDGTAVSGWPKMTGSKISSSPALGDINRDGYIEVLVGSWDTYVYLWTFDGAYNPRYIAWGMYRHDRAHTGQYGVPYDDMPDLTVTGITYTPPWPRPGEQVEFQATLTNVGSKDGSAFVVSWLLDGQEVASEDHTGLAAGASVALSCTLIAAAGDHTIEIMADAASMVDELDEDNNRSSLSFTVLTEQGIDIVAHRVVFVPEVPMPGDTVLVRIELENQGDGPSGPFHIAWRINGIEVARQAHTGLARGEIAYPEYTWNTVSGIYTVTVVADSDGEVAEYNEGNNSVTQGIDVTAVDLAAGPIAWSPVHPNRGDTIVLNVTLENRGDKVSGPFSVRWRIDGGEVAQASYNTYAPGVINYPQYVWIGVERGAHTVEFTADYAGEVTESNESNNTAVADIIVGPLMLDTGGRIYSSPALADLDGDGETEIIVGSCDRFVYAWHGNGTAVSGWPRMTMSTVWSSPAVGDLDGDGSPEVVVGSWDSRVYAWHGDGTAVSGWPQITRSKIYSAPALGDIDGDGDLEVVVGSCDRFVHAWHGDGTPVSGWPQMTGSTILSSPALGDVDGDGDVEVVVGSTDRWVYAWHGDGTPVSGWPQMTGSKVISSAAIGDIDGDGDLEVIVGSFDRQVYAWHGDGTTVSGWPQMAGSYIESSPALGDIDGDGDLEVAVGSYDSNLYVWHGDGTPVSGWPQATGYRITSSPVLADIDGDGDSEIVVGSMDRRVYAWHGDGSPVAGWPRETGNQVRSSPAIGDPDGDGAVEVAIGSADTMLYIWQLDGTFRPANMEWPLFRGNAARTGAYQPPGIFYMSDLAVLDMIVYPAFPVDGELVDICATVINNGGSESDTFRIRWLIDGEEVMEETCGMLLPAEVSTAVYYWVAEAGEHEIECIVDCYDDIEEIDEVNNRYRFTIIVGRD